MIRDVAINMRIFIIICKKNSTKKKKRLFCARIRGNEKEKYIFKKTQRISDNHDICRISSSKRPGTYLKISADGRCSIERIAYHETINLYRFSRLNNFFLAEFSCPRFKDLAEKG